MGKNFFFEEKDQVVVPIESFHLFAFQKIPKDASKLVVIAHGSGSSRYSHRDQFVSKIFYESGLGVFFMDLLTTEEEKIDLITRHLRFDIQFLAKRLIEIVNWLENNQEFQDLSKGIFGASTGAAAAIVTAAEVSAIKAVVSRGGRPDLAGDYLKMIHAPTLLIVGGDDYDVLELNQRALGMMNCPKKLEIISGATHLFEEPGTLEQAAHLSRDWFLEYL